MSDPNPQIVTQSETGGVKIVGSNIYGTYDTARGVASFFAFFGWLIVVGGIIAAVVGLSLGTPFNVLGIAIGIGIAAIGLLLVAAQQMLRAAVDSADYARQALLLQIGVAQRRPQIDLGGASFAVPGVLPATPSPKIPHTKSLGPIEQTYDYKGKKILKIGNDFFIEGHGQAYNSLYTVRVIIDRGDV